MALNTIKASNIEDGTIAGIDFDDNSISSDNIAALSSSKLSGALPATKFNLNKFDRTKCSPDAPITAD